MKICIVIPLYNEASRFDIEALTEFTKNNTIKFCLVNDGSTDNTKQIIDELAAHNDLVSAINLQNNKGKAEAIRTAFNELIQTKDYNYIGYFDADFATPLEELHNFITEIEKSNKPFVMGIRLKRIGANIQRYKARHYFGRIVASIISELILKLPIYDTQCGAKLIETKLAKELFREPFKTKWLFDVELISRIQKNHGREFCLNNIVELPLNTWIDKGDSRLSLFDFIKTPFNLFKIYFAYR